MRRAGVAMGFLCLSGCAVQSPPLGHDYAQPAFDHFVLSESTVREAEALLGPPMGHSTVTSLAPATARLVAPGTKISVTVLNYYYAPLGTKGPGPHPAKTAILLFVADHLLGYQLSNSIPGEVTPPITEDRLAVLHQGRTTRLEAIALLGTPLRQLMHLNDAQSGASEIAYGWTRRKGSEIEQRTLRITFDAAGRMTTYAVLENSFPLGGAPMLQLPPPAPPPRPGQLVPHGDREHT